MSTQISRRPTSASCSSSTRLASICTPLMRHLATEAPTPIKTHSKLNEADIEKFASILSTPETSLLTTIKTSATPRPVDSSELEVFNNDWMNKYHGKSSCVLKPKSTKEVSEIMKYCSERKLAVVPQGGNTGLVGGGVPVLDEVIVSLSNLKNIRSFDEINGTLVCDAGCILESLDKHVGDKGFMMPLDLGAKGSCHIGGNVATNAGGLRFLRYGSLHGNVLGLEVVLPNGTVLDALSTLRKDNTGFDLKQLFIGSEGTIGLITGVSIVTPRRPNAVNVAVFAVESFEAVQNVYTRVKSHCGEILSAFEFFDSQSMKVVKHHGIKDPFQDKHPFYVLIETSGSNKEHDDEKLNGLLEDLMESSAISDGVLAQDETQLQSLWSVRESIAEAAGKMGSVFKYDVSMPVDKMNELVEDMRKRFNDKGMLGEGKKVKEVVGYGHIGDGNLHINIIAESYDPEVESVIEPYIYEWISNVNGSISAEHGLGRMKGEKIGYSKSPTSVALMKDIKHMFDPDNILNPYKVRFVSV
jgi:FAD/FMN-containing dehydrogenase